MNGILDRLEYLDDVSCVSFARVENERLFFHVFLMMCRVKTDSLLKVFLKILSDFFPGVRTQLPGMITERMCLLLPICSNLMNHINGYWK